jgi:hypothetical protein
MVSGGASPQSATDEELGHGERTRGAHSDESEYAPARAKLKSLEILARGLKHLNVAGVIRRFEERMEQGNRGVEILQKDRSELETRKNDPNHSVSYNRSNVESSFN